MAFSERSHPWVVEEDHHQEVEEEVVGHYQEVEEVVVDHYQEVEEEGVGQPQEGEGEEVVLHQVVLVEEGVEVG